MKRRVGNFIIGKNMDRMAEINFHDFINMIESGLGDEEIASELGVHKCYINKLKNEMQKDF